MEAAAAAAAVEVAVQAIILSQVCSKWVRFSLQLTNKFGPRIAVAHFKEREGGGEEEEEKKVEDDEVEHFVRLFARLFVSFQ